MTSDELTAIMTYLKEREHLESKEAKSLVVITFYTPTNISPLCRHVCQRPDLTIGMKSVHDFRHITFRA